MANPDDRTSAPKASDQAYAHLRQMIVSLKLEPGSTVDENFLSKTLGYGRTPVREALLRLADKKLIEIKPRKGTFVAPMRLQDLRKVEELRWHMESLATRWAVERITDEELTDLERLIRDAEGGAFNESSDWDVEVDRTFHLLLAKAAKNPFLEEELERLYDHSVRMMYATRTSMSPATEELPDYRRIIQALRNRDGAAAERGMQLHLRASRKQTANNLEASLVAGVATGE